MAKHPTPEPEPPAPDELHTTMRPEKVLTKPDPPAPTPKTTPTPHEGEITRVLLTTADRNVVTEEWVPTPEYGFRIVVNGQAFEQVAIAVDSGTTIFAPTR